MIPELESNIHDLKPEDLNTALAPLSTTHAWARQATPSGRFKKQVFSAEEFQADQARLLGICKGIKGHVCRFPTEFMEHQVLSMAESIISSTTVPL